MNILITNYLIDTDAGYIELIESPSYTSYIQDNKLTIEFDSSNYTSILTDASLNATEAKNMPYSSYEVVFGVYRLSKYKITISYIEYYKQIYDSEIISITQALSNRTTFSKKDTQLFLNKSKDINKADYVLYMNNNNPSIYIVDLSPVVSEVVNFITYPFDEGTHTIEDTNIIKKTYFFIDEDEIIANYIKCLNKVNVDENLGITILPSVEFYLLDDNQDRTDISTKNYLLYKANLGKNFSSLQYNSEYSVYVRRREILVSFEFLSISLKDCRYFLEQYHTLQGLGKVRSFNNERVDFSSGINDVEELPNNGIDDNNSSLEVNFNDSKFHVIRYSTIIITYCILTFDNTPLINQVNLQINSQRST